MAGIFISYRRADSISATGRLHEYLENAFGAEHVFKDVEDIPPGVDFREHLRNSIANCNIVLVMIGNRWVNITDADGDQRLFKPDDWVRTEVATALASPETMTIPILVEGAQPPQADDLPDDLKELAYRNAYQLRNDPDFPSDARKLIDFLRTQMGDIAPPPKTETPPKRRLPGGFLIGIVVGVIALFAFLLALPTDEPTDTPTALLTEAAVAEEPTLDVQQQSQQQAQEVIEDEPTLAPTPTSASESNVQQQVVSDFAGETDVYTDDFFGYSFSYPADWEVISEEEEGNGMYAVDGGEFLIFVYTFADHDGTLQDVSTQIENVFNNVIYQDQENVTAAGHPALAYTWINLPLYRSRSLAIIVDGLGFVFAVEPAVDGEVDEDDQEEIFRLMASTLAFN